MPVTSTLVYYIRARQEPIVRVESHKGPHYGRLWETTLQMTDIDKHTSLKRYWINYGRKTSYSSSLSRKYWNLFFFLKTLHQNKLVRL